MPQRPSLPSITLSKSALKPPKPCWPSIPSSKQPKSALKSPKPSLAESATFPTVVAQDSIALNWALPGLFDKMVNMLITYTIRTSPSIPPVQHAQRKLPIEFQEQIECTLDNMVAQGVIASVSQHIEWVSSLTYPQKPDNSLLICLNPKDLNKAIVQEHYKAPTLNEISHWLNSDTNFSTLDAKDGFWSIHLKRSLTTWPHSTPTMAGSSSCACLSA